MGQYPPKRRTKRNIAIRLAAVLFCLTLCSTYLVTGLFARYAVSAESSEQARVAAFSIKGDGALSQTIQAGLTPGKSETVSLRILNASEVAVGYTIEVANETKNLPLSFAVVKKGGTLSEWKKDNATFTDQQMPGNHTDEYDLRILWEKGDDDLKRMGMVDYISVTVTATQID